ncbi:hypothetical protein S245_043610, partial [Arachis hypogaea]
IFCFCVIFHDGFFCWFCFCSDGLKDSERGFGADAVTLAEEIWKACERESLESSIEAAFKAIRSRGTDSHVPSHCEWLSVHRNFVRHYLAFTNRHRSDVGYRICIFFIYLALWPYYWPCDRILYDFLGYDWIFIRRYNTFKVNRTRAALVFIFGFWMLDLANNTVQGPAWALLADDLF